MKKLLILGGSRYILPVIKCAKDLGVYVITCDYLPNNFAHRYSDEYVNASIIDKELILNEAKRLKVDGIMSFACDPGVTTAAYVASQLGLPSCGPYESVCILQNKGKFRRFLRDNGFNVPVSKSYTVVDDVLRDIDMFNWPVIVKPVDSAGSKGVSRVDEPEKISAAASFALLSSHSGEFIVEDYIKQKGYSSDTDSFSVDGKLKFISFNSQMFDKSSQNPYTPAAFSWPTEMSKSSQEELTSEISRLISLLHMGTSIYNIETREDKNGKPYIMECSPRGGGNRLAECLEYATGVKLIENAVRSALGMPLVGVENKHYDGYWAEIVLHSNQPGIYDELFISDEIASNLVESDVWVSHGDKIQGFHAANESLGTVILKFDTQEKLRKVMNDIDNFVKIVVKND